MHLVSSNSAAALPVVHRPTRSITREEIEGAFAPATWRAYRAALDAWEAFASDRGLEPLPVDPGALCDWIRHLDAGGAKHSTIRVRVAALKTISKTVRAPFPIDADRELLMRSIARRKGTRPDQHQPLLTPDVRELLEHLPADGILNLRDRAIMLLTYAGAFRRSEVAAIDVEHLTWKRDGLLVLLPRSKTDQEGRGQLVAVAYGAKPATCPVRALKAYLAAAGDPKSGPLFRVTKRGRLLEERIADQVIYRLVKKLCARAGMDPADFGAHSLRAGHITQAITSGADPIRARDQARHTKLDTTLGYHRPAVAIKTSTSSDLDL